MRAIGLLEEGFKGSFLGLGSGMIREDLNEDGR